MNKSGPESWLSRLLGAAITLVVAALLLTWAWALLRPLVPVIAVCVAVGTVVSFTAGWWFRRRNEW